MSASEMATQGQGTKRRKEEKAKKYRKESAFAQNVFFIFNKTTELVSEYDIDGVDLLNQMLHSILFLGNINATPYSPDDIFAEKEIYLKTMTDFPQPFERYREDVALRTSFSYFLELIVRCFGENKGKVKAKLCEKLQGCEKSGPFISSVICICQVSNRMYYGESLTCPGERERQIMIAVTCLHVWNP
ncbi:hypothetical protein AOLI_G00319750 [Acnodon oligacanthus]